MRFDILQTGLVTSLGDSLPLIRAAMAAEVSAYCLSCDADLEAPPKVAPVPDAALPAPPKASNAPRSWQLLARALEGFDRSLPLLVNIESSGDRPLTEERSTLSAQYLGYPAERVRWFSGGRAALPALLEGASRMLASGAAGVILAAVESGCEPVQLSTLCASGRALTPGQSDGRVAAEAAVALSLTEGDRFELVGAGNCMTQAWDQRPDLGALATAFQSALDTAGAPPLGAVFSTASGERILARELALALTRAEPGTAAGARVELPARLLGDLGAAAPLVHLLLASDDLRCQALLGSDDNGGRSATLIRFNR